MKATTAAAVTLAPLSCLLRPSFSSFPSFATLPSTRKEAQNQAHMNFSEIAICTFGLYIFSEHSSCRFSYIEACLSSKQTPWKTTIPIKVELSVIRNIDFEPSHPIFYADSNKYISGEQRLAESRLLKFIQTTEICLIIILFRSFQKLCMCHLSDCENQVYNWLANSSTSVVLFQQELPMVRHN